MHQQSLPGFVPLPSENHNLFFALWPDDETRQRMAAAASMLQHGQALGGRWIGSHRYHLTLKFLGEYPYLPATLIDTAIAAAASVHAQAFDLVLDTVGSFAKNHQIRVWLGCREESIGLRALFDAICGALGAKSRAAAAISRLVPHVTLLRESKDALNLALEVPIRWRIEEFVLIHSCTKPFAPYQLLGRWPLP